MSALPELTVAKVIQACGKIEGRVKLQKIVYLLSAMGYELPFRDFQVSYHGPFSPQLAGALDFLVDARVLEEKEIEVGSEHPRFDYEPSPRYSELLSTYVQVTGPQDKPGLRKIASRLAQQDRPTLEIAATMCFLEREEGCSRDVLRSELKGLKGHLPEFDTIVEEAHELLSELGLRVS
jgi:uncharacterized protein YwgA